MQLNITHKDWISFMVKQHSCNLSVLMGGSNVLDSIKKLVVYGKGIHIFSSFY